MERNMSAPPAIDSHQHFWRTGEQHQAWLAEDHDALRRDFLPSHLRPLLAQAEISGTVAMQSVDSPRENDLLRRYEEHDIVAGVVSWLPVSDPATARDELDRVLFRKHSGVRCLVADDPMDWLGGSDVRALFRELAIRDLTWDVVPITAEQIAAVAGLARDLPDLRIVIDHLGRPPIDTSGWEPWATNISRLAELPNVAMKLSVGINVLSSWKRWDPAAIAPYAKHAIASFGPGRLMLGSNWPVVELGTDFVTAWSDLRAIAFDELGDPKDRASIAGGTATAVYGLRVNRE
jgi:L-fuconolactonase